MHGASQHRAEERRRIDHVVIAVRNLDRAADFYRRLGFQVGTRNLHPWGTENRIIQFGCSFVELITVGAHANLIPPHERRRFSFGAFIRDYLQQREGIAMLVITSKDAQSDAALFAERGIGHFETFSFERNGVKPDGAPTRVAFSLAFAIDPDAPEAGFFVCQQHLPENFWDSRFQDHQNGARNVRVVALTARAPERHVAFFTTFTGAHNEEQEAGRYTFPLQDGRIELLQSSHVREALLTSFTVEVNDLQAVASILASEKIDFAHSDDAIVIGASSAFGVEMRFVDARQLGTKT
jgi:catechol 2,3-dioxygenase-like lactoylglutathione lyase family enzyme